MTVATDQEYLQKDQYRDASNLNARMALHARFGTEKIGWHPWVFEQFHLPPDARVLELGCGPGQLWVQNIDRLPPGWKVTLSDFSPGMIEQAQQNLAGSGFPFAFAQFDAQSIPFDDASFDAVIANHMLYHVPDRTKAYAEVRRVLRPGGAFYAATNGHDNMRQLMELEDVMGDAGGLRPFAADPNFFALENGEAELKEAFAGVELRRTESALLVTEAQPLIDYILSGADRSKVTDGMLSSLRATIDTRIEEEGAFRIDKIAGLFIAANG